MEPGRRVSLAWLGIRKRMLKKLSKINLRQFITHPFNIIISYLGTKTLRRPAAWSLAHFPPMIQVSLELGLGKKFLWDKEIKNVSILKVFRKKVDTKGVSRNFQLKVSES